jgi:hypothetical protein
MKNLFDQEAYQEIVQRLHQLRPDSQRQWGKMNPAQALAHLCRGLKVALADKPLKRMWIGYILGPLMKHKLYNDTPWKSSLPTAPDFVVNDLRDFETERTKLLALVQRFHEAGPSQAGQFPHPFFGSMTPEQWGKSIYKHLDHHLRQFGQ